MTQILSLYSVNIVKYIFVAVKENECLFYSGHLQFVFIIIPTYCYVRTVLCVVVFQKIIYKMESECNKRYFKMV